ncbi:MAG: hypothetical protein ACRCXM_09990 [Beijerinckiaceae bacterium]
MRTDLASARSLGLRVKRFVFVAALAGLLAACNDVGSDLGTVTNAPKVSAPGVPIAVESLTGGSDAMRNRFAGALSQEATTRQIELVGSGATPRYRIRGYLDAYTGEDGKNALKYVWDVYDTGRKRAQRVEGTTPLRSGSDPWAAVDDRAIQVAASQCMNEIAGFLVAAGPAPDKKKTALAEKKSNGKPMAFSGDE